MRGYSSRRSPSLLVTLLLACSIIGGLVGILLLPVAPWAGKNLISLGASSFTLDLYVLSLTLGAFLKLNLGSLIGMILAIVIYFRI